MSLPSLFLDAFYACAQTGHFTQAASHLGITQSALSQRILKLEEELETALFLREKTGARLTPAGYELLRYCAAKDSLEQESLERIKSPKKEGLSGYLRIGGFSSVMRSVVLPALKPLLSENPNVRLLFLSKEMDELPDLLKTGKIDFMILHHEWIRDELESLKIGEEKNVLCQKKGYDGPNIFLDHDENDQTTSRYFHMKRSKKRYERRYLDEVYGLIDGVKYGYGRAILPTHLVRDEKGIEIVDKKTVLRIPVVLHYYKQPFYTRLHKEVVRHLSEAQKLL